MKLSVSEHRFYVAYIIIAMMFCLSWSIIPGGVAVATYITPIAVYCLVWIIFCAVLRYRYDADIDLSLFVKLLLCWNVIILIRGYWNATDYWDYRGLVMSRTPALLLPIVVYMGGSLELMSKIYSFVLKVYIPVSMLIVKSVFYQVIGVPILFLVPWIGLLSRRWYKYVFILFIILSINLSARAWSLRLLFAFLLLFISLFKGNKQKILLRGIYTVMVAAPIFFALLAYIGKFNVLDAESYIDISNGKIPTVDTRSHLYTMVHEKLEKENMVLIGLGGVSEYWHGFNSEYRYSDNKGFSQKGRDRTESGLLNMYLCGGMIGVILYSLLFVVSAYKAIFCSNSRLCVLLGIFLLFRWIISFVDEPENWLASMIILYMTIGICLSRKFRTMSDDEVKMWIKTI